MAKAWRLAWRAFEIRLANVETRLASIEIRMANVETRLANVETRLASVETRPGLIGEATKHQRRIGAAESERIRQCDIDGALFRLMRHQIDRGCDRRIVQIEGRRHDSVSNRQNREDRLHGAGGAEQMPDRGLGGGHAQAFGG